MTTVAQPDFDAERVALLQRLDLLDNAPEEIFDRLTRLAARVLKTPTVLITFLDHNRQWVKSRVGSDLLSTPRDIAFCAHAILQDEPLIVPDARSDARFASNPLVTNAPFIGAYLGVQINSSQGIALGTLCAIDTQARDFSREDVTVMQDLVALVRREIMHREAVSLSRVVYANSDLALRDSEMRFRSTFEQAAVGISMLDLEGRWIRVNRKLCEIVGYDEDELVGRSFLDLTFEEDQASHISLLRATLAGAEPSYSIEKRYRHRDGQPVWVNLTISLTRDGQGAPLYFTGIAENIETRKAAEAALHALHADLENRVSRRTAELKAANENLSRVVAQLGASEQSASRSRETLQAIADNLPVLIAYIDRDMKYRFNNRMYHTIFGLDPASLFGKPVVDVLEPRLLAQLQPFFERALKGERLTYENLVYDEPSGRFWNATYIPHVRDGAVEGFHVMSQDVTERQLHELSLTRQALHDALTGLPNRRALTSRLEAAITHAREFGRPCAVLFLDLDGLKQVNDTLGHEAGDKLLQETARRLLLGVRATDTVARLAGDEFVVLLEALSNGQEDAVTIARTLISVVAEPLAIAGTPVKPSVSIGVATYAPATGLSAESLLEAADRAMYAAKRAGKNTFKIATDLV